MVTSLQERAQSVHNLARDVALQLGPTWAYNDDKSNRDPDGDLRYNAYIVNDDGPVISVGMGHYGLKEGQAEFGGALPRRTELGKHINLSADYCPI